MKAAVLLVLLALATAPVATAKELTRAVVCGGDACRTIEHPSPALSSGGDGFPDVAPPARPLHRLTLTVDHGAGSESWVVWWDRRDRVLAFRGEDGTWRWDRLAGKAAAAYDAATAGLEPFPTAAGPWTPAQLDAVAAEADGFPWLLAAAVTGGLVVLAAVALLLRRRRIGPPTRAAAV